MEDRQSDTGFFDDINHPRISVQAHRILVTKAHTLNAGAKKRHGLCFIGTDEMEVPNSRKSAGPLNDFIFVQLLGDTEDGTKNELRHLAVNCHWLG